MPRAIVVHVNLTGKHTSETSQGRSLTQGHAAELRGHDMVVVMVVCGQSMNATSGFTSATTWATAPCAV